ncbi:MAG: hypothetical protein NTW50_01410 [Candidatus Berkelbacteria bacterium]|nr:hypothetical protein [Candidatus Berkelbacteria bacterium]
MYNKIANPKYKTLRHILAVPFIWGMVIPVSVLDLFLEIYHHVAFPLYGLTINKRSNYIRIDRQKLSYLGLMEKIMCVYCGYANGLFAYAVKIAGDTEAYWCGIKHKEGKGYIPQPHQEDFLPYGDEKAYKEFIDPEKCKLDKRDK